MVKKNENKQVIEISKEAFSKLPDRVAACKKLTQLKAVGPATASGKACSSIIGIWYSFIQQIIYISLHADSIYVIYSNLLISAINFYNGS